MIGTVVVILFLLDLPDVSLGQVLEFLIIASGGVLLMMVVAADQIVGLLRLEHAQAKAWVGTDLAGAFEEKLSALDLENQASE